MNILILTNTYKPHVGGVAHSVEAFAVEFRRRGHRVLVISPELEGCRGRRRRDSRPGDPALQRERLLGAAAGARVSVGGPARFSARHRPLEPPLPAGRYGPADCRRPERAAGVPASHDVRALHALRAGRLAGVAAFCRRSVDRVRQPVRPDHRAERQRGVDPAAAWRRDPDHDDPHGRRRRALCPGRRPEVSPRAGHTGRRLRRRTRGPIGAGEEPRLSGPRGGGLSAKESSRVFCRDRQRAVGRGNPPRLRPATALGAVAAGRGPYGPGSRRRPARHGRLRVRLAQRDPGHGVDRGHGGRRSRGGDRCLRGARSRDRPAQRPALGEASGSATSPAGWRGWPSAARRSDGRWPTPRGGRPRNSPCPAAPSKCWRSIAWRSSRTPARRSATENGMRASGSRRSAGSRPNGNCGRPAPCRPDCAARHVSLANARSWAGAYPGSGESGGR